jgi:hypothetical protein
MENILKDVTADLCPSCDVLFHDADAMGCCGYCGQMDAYRELSGKWLSDNLFLKLKERYNWNERYGFLDLNRGCKLPRIYRADICLTFMCGELRKRLSITEQKMLDNLISRILYDRYSDPDNNMMEILDRKFV